MKRTIIARPAYLKKLQDYTGSDLIRVITGVRRCGKSSLLLMYRNWLEERYGKDSILYIKFDGPEFLLDKTLKAMAEKLKKNITDKTQFLLLDEVQLIENWEEAVNAYYSTGKYEIILTGSNAKMLSSELATLLTGRYTEIEMLPLSFKEYVQFINNEKMDIEKDFDNYLTYGGFPIIALFDNPIQKNDILQSILDSILFNDIRPKVGPDANNETPTRLVAFLNDATGYPVSINNLIHRIKSAGYKMYYELINKYMDAFKSSYLYYETEFHMVKGGERFGKTDKYYPIDTGLLTLTKGNMSENYGVLLETIVYLELKRNGYKVSVGRNDNDNSEIDFIAERGKNRLYLQVTASLMDENTRKRKFRSLEAIKDNYPKLILSMDHHDFSCNGIQNRFIPDFLLSDYLEN